MTWGELTGENNVPLFVELAGAAAFSRTAISARSEFEGGLRLAWLYHPPTEYETIFTGGYVALLRHVGRISIGPRLHLGRLQEEAGRSQFVVGITPLTARVKWVW